MTNTPKNEAEMPQIDPILVEKQQLMTLFGQLDAADKTLLAMRNPEKMFEIMRAREALRHAYQWIADGYSLFTLEKFANVK